MAASRTITLKAIQCNLGRGQTAFRELIAKCLSSNIDLALIQEPYIGNTGSVRSNSSFKLFQCHTNRDVRAAILVFNHLLKPILQTVHSNSDITTIDTTFDNKVHRFSSIYNPPNTDITSLLIKLSIARQTADRMIIGGDINSSHQIWTNMHRPDENGDSHKFLYI